MVRGHLAISGLKKHFQHIFIFGNENKPVGIVMQIIGHRLDKAPWLVRMAEHTLTENNDFHALLQRAWDNSMKWLFLPVLSYKCQNWGWEWRKLGQTPQPLLLRQCRISHTLLCNWGVCAFDASQRVVMHSRVETPRHRQIGRWSFTQVPISPSHK